MKNLIAIIMLGAMLVGCATSSTPNLYTVNMTPSENAGSPVNVVLGRLRTAESLLSKRIMIKKSPTEVEYFATAQWAASLDEILREKMAAEFGPIDTARPTYVVSGDLQAFEQVDMAQANEAHIKLRLEVRHNDDSQYAPALLTKVYEESLPISGETPSDVVEALSVCLETVARAIVADVAALQ